MTKRIAIAELEVKQVQWLMNELCKEYGLSNIYTIHDAANPLCIEAITAHNPSGFVEVPDELVEGNQ